MPSKPFVPADFSPPVALIAPGFRLEPLGPQHNRADLTAWTSSIDHIRSMPGYPYGQWPPREGLTPAQNLRDLERHAADFEARRGFTFTVLDPAEQVVGCVYFYPSDDRNFEMEVRFWVVKDRPGLAEQVADTVAEWLLEEWPWRLVKWRGR